MLLSFSPHSTFLTQFNEGSYMAAVNIRCFNRHISISSQPLRPVPLPRPMEAHMWYVIPDEIKGTSLLEQYLEILSPSEKQTVLSLKDDELRKRAILARTLVRTTIARYQTNPTIDPRSLSFKKNSYGKPEESYVKAVGRGFPATSFNTFRISCKASSISVSDVPYIASSKRVSLEFVVQCALLSAFLASCPCNWNLADNNGYFALFGIFLLIYGHSVLLKLIFTSATSLMLKLRILCKRGYLTLHLRPKYMTRYHRKG
ncbi:hypothetical protein Cgig2_010984 [Carnegiea gigantea]|uniref:holo-[acyl-carrier-protein] synthase n=1 Tax=Carnegiea gigantea TaxID=171969 RepID=A0A9Q1JY56_9CARY|nr:hypothetical protein Cgig2_010984 [Carnegiea gigantea]